MEDLSRDDKQSTSRHRSPTFTKEEVHTLLNLVEKYKLFVLNKSTTSVACQAKEVAWSKIAKQFNNPNFGHIRNADTLRTKWENLKRDARKITKNILDTSNSELDAVNGRIVLLLSSADSIGSVDAPQDMSEDEIDTSLNELEEQKESSNFQKYWNENIESEGGDDHFEKSKRSSRSQNFSPQECKLLLQCVRKEKKHIFCRETTGKAIELKNMAWSRITDSYNRLSPQKRSAKNLRTKFLGMKKMAKKVGSKIYSKDLASKLGKHDKKATDSFKNIKKEPLYEDSFEGESDHYSDHDDTDFNTVEDRANYVDVPAEDPLSSVLNGDSGIGSSSSNMGCWNWNQSENKEIVKLKLELLNYQLETAKLERKRLEDTMKEESSTQEARETERSLRLRAARLDAIAASLRLPSSHPALHFPPEESRAHMYLTQYHHT